MTRVQIPILMKTLLSILSLTLLATIGAEPQTNVLFLAVDDLRPELGCYGKKILSPHIDELAAQGTLFTRAYCQVAVCGASPGQPDDWATTHLKTIPQLQYFRRKGRPRRHDGGRGTERSRLSLHFQR